MTIPTPSDFAKLQMQRKPLEKKSSAKHDRTTQKNRARYGSDKAPATSSKEEAKNSSKPSSKSTSKRPFVRNPHLTQRLSENEKLQELKESFPQMKHHNRSTKKHTGSTSKKK